MFTRVLGEGATGRSAGPRPPCCLDPCSTHLSLHLSPPVSHRAAALPCPPPRLTADGRSPMPGEAGSPFALLRAAPSHTQGDPCTSHGCGDRYTRCPPRRFLLPAFEPRLRWAAVRSGARGAARGPPSPAGGVQTAAPARAPAHSRFSETELTQLWVSHFCAAHSPLRLGGSVPSAPPPALPGAPRPAASAWGAPA